LNEPEDTKLHMMFSLFMDPRYCVTLKPLLEFHQCVFNDDEEGRQSTVNYVNSMKKRLVEYVEAMDKALNPDVDVSHVDEVAQDKLYDDDDDGGAPDNQIQMEFKMLRDLSKRKVCNTDVLSWYETVKVQIPRLYRFAQIIFSIPPTQIQNERDFSLAGVFTRARRASMTNVMLSNLLFINQNIKIKKSFEAFGEDNVDDSLIEEAELFMEENNEIENKDDD
jgi:hAT family C-terminal dimerisation region